MFCNIIPLLVGLLSALLGGLIGWYWLKNSKLAGLSGLVDEKESHLSNLRSDLNAQDLNYQRLHSDHSAVNASLSDWQGKHSSLTTELGDWKGKFNNLTTELSDWKGKHSGITAELATLGAAKIALDSNFNQYKTNSSLQIAALETELADSKKKYADLDASHKNWAIQSNNWNTEKETLNKSILALRTEGDSKTSEWEGRGQQFNTERNELTAKIVQLEKDSKDGHDYWESRVKQLNDEKDAVTKQLQQKEGEIANVKRENTEGVTHWQSKYSGLEMQLTQAKEATQKSSADWESRYRQLETERNDYTLKVSKLEKDNKDGYDYWQNQINQLNLDKDSVGSQWQSKYNGLQTELTQSKEATQKLGADWEGKYRQLDTEHNSINTRLSNLQKNMDAASRDFENRETELETEIARLKAEVDKKPQGIIARDKNEVEQEQMEILERIKSRVAKGEIDAKGFAAWGGGKGDNLKRLRGVNAFIEKKMNAAGLYTFRQIAYLNNDEQTKLNTIFELSNKKFQKEEWVFQAKRLIGLISEESPDAVLARIRTHGTEMNVDRIGAASAEGKDNLQLINYVTAFDEAKLNALGIFKYSQIANFNKTDVKLVNKLIEIEEGRIGNEDWVSQSNYLNTSAFEATLSRINGRSEQVEWSRIGRFDASEKEDLQVVSGIGQFIEQKLYALGIYRLEQISKFNAADEMEMNTILELVPGHIQGDAWVAQAKKVMKERK